MSHRVIPQLKAGPLSASDAAALNNLLRWLAGRVGGFSAAAPLQIREDASGVSISLDKTSLAGGLTSPLTTKGDLWGWDTTNNRVPIGTNGQVLTANSAVSLGLDWETPVAYSSTFTGARMSLNGGVTVPNNTDTLAGPWGTFSTGNFDTGSFSGHVYIPVSYLAYFIICAQITFIDSSSTGFRSVALSYGTPGLSGNEVFFAATTITPAQGILDGNRTHLCVSGIIKPDINRQQINIHVSQTSGGSLTLETTSSGIPMTEVQIARLLIPNF